VREQDHLADGRLVGQQHDQAIDADPLARRGRHAVLQRPHVVLVEPVGLVVTARLHLRLLLEAGQLVDRIVELAVGVGQLAPADVELEAIHQACVVPLALGQG
jgi:hypothetical protein